MISKKIKDITEEEIVSALLRRDRDAVGILYDKYSAFLFGIISRIVHSAEIAEDLLQEVFVRVWENIKGYDSSKSKLITWMANISRNLAIDKIRSKEYKNSLQNQDIDNFVNVIEASGSGGFNPDHVGIKELLEKLNPEQQKLIDLVYFKGYTQSDAAKELNIPLGTVKTRLRAAIGVLRKVFNVSE